MQLSISIVRLRIAEPVPKGVHSALLIANYCIMHQGLVLFLQHSVLGATSKLLSSLYLIMKIKGNCSLNLSA